MVTFTGRRFDGKTIETLVLAEAEAFAVANPETGEIGECGVFGYNPESPCCEGPCSHEVNVARG